MNSRTAAFDAAVVKSHTMIMKAEVWGLVNNLSVPLQTIASPTYDGSVVTEGEVTADATTAIRRRLTLTLIDEDGSLTPTDMTSLIAPNGNEVKVYRGIRYPDGTDEFLGLGVFGISRVVANNPGPGSTLSITGYDRSRRVARGRLTQDYSIASGTNAIAAIFALVQKGYPQAVADVSNPTTTATTGSLYYSTGTDCWKAATNLAESFGYIIYFDINGNWAIRSVGDPSASPVSWDFTDNDLSIILADERELDDEQVYNHWIVTGESTSSSPVRGEAVDDDPNSPTYYLGNFGDVPTFEAIPTITTQSQANSAAAAFKNRAKGAQEDLRSWSIVHSSFEPGDVITRTRSALKLSGTKYVIDKLSFPLVAARGMDLSTRRLTNP